ncbi:TPA: hypothetical protein OT855_004858 [Serratia liquefaciens]|uniref:hypothetical protein n=1 Tax=Serratia liquefaciens TaxID=614 RepID=UPI0022A1C181|nr:hypothetical protein [Serratia liquefaciens]
MFSSADVQPYGRESFKKIRTVGFSSNLRVTAYSYVKMLKIRAKPCKNKMNLINSQQGHFRYAAQPVMGPQGVCGWKTRIGPLSLVG